MKIGFFPSGLTSIHSQENFDTACVNLVKSPGATRPSFIIDVEQPECKACVPSLIAATPVWLCDSVGHLWVTCTRKHMTAITSLWNHTQLFIVSFWTCLPTTLMWLICRLGGSNGMWLIWLAQSAVCADRANTGGKPFDTPWLRVWWLKMPYVQSS